MNSRINNKGTFPWLFPLWRNSAQPGGRPAWDWMNRRLFPVPVPYFSNCAVLFWNSGLVIERAVGCLAIHFFVRLYEEPTLARRHPEDYPRYKRHVPRWLPRLTPWQDAGAGQGQ